MNAPGSDPRPASRKRISTSSIEIFSRADVACHFYRKLFVKDNRLVGAILIGSDLPLAITSRTYNDQGDDGTYGQFIRGFHCRQPQLLSGCFHSNTPLNASRATSFHLEGKSGFSAVSVSSIEYKRPSAETIG